MGFSRLPPLNSLRAFEAVARHRSFRKAAEELFVTPAAVTHQIKSLEKQLGLKLFERLSRRIELTDAAQAALPLFQQGFESLAAAVAELRGYGQVPHLTVGATPTFVSRWLMPRLQRFMSRHPGIDVRIVASGRVISTYQRTIRSEDASNEELETDIDIRFASDHLHGESVDLLFKVEIMPMCHPRLIEGPPALRVPEDLRHQTLLHGDGRFDDRNQSAWAQWLRRVGVKGVDARRGLQLDHSTHALEAAADGLGVTLASPLLAAAELSSGRVVIAFPQALPLDNAYYIITADSTKHRPEVMAFRNWLLEEAGLDHAPHGTRVAAA